MEESKLKKWYVSPDAAMKYANIFYLGGMVPRGCNRVETVASIIIFGSELGIDPAQCMAQIYMCNGKPTTWGKMPFALVRKSGFLESYSEKIENEGGEYAIATFTAKRKGQDNEVTRSFSYADAQKAGLFMKGGKPGPWDCHTDHMLLLRATARALEALFQDVLCGLSIGENLDNVDLPYVSPHEENAVPTTQGEAGKPAINTSISDRKGSADANQTPPTCGIITDAQRNQMKDLLPGWFASKGLNPETDMDACRAAWNAWLAEKYQIKRVSELTEPRANEMLKEVQKEIDAVHPSVSGLFAQQETLLSQKEDTSAIKN